MIKSARFCPHRLEDQDAALSRPKPGFESPWGHSSDVPEKARLFLWTADGERQTAAGQAFQPVRRSRPSTNGERINEWGTADRGRQTAKWTMDSRQWTVIGRAFQPVGGKTVNEWGTNQRMKTTDGSLPGRSPVNEGRGKTLCLCVLVVYSFLTTKTRRHNKQTADGGPQTAIGQAFQAVRRWTVDDRPWTVDRSMGFQARHGWRRHGRQGWSRGNRPVRRQSGRRLRCREQYHNGLCKG